MIGILVAVLLLLALVLVAIGLHFYGVASALEAMLSPYHPAPDLYRDSAAGLLQMALVFGVVAGGLALLAIWGAL